MKYILLSLLLTFLGLFSYGYYLNSEVPKSGDKWIGISVLLVAFVIMPVFLASRYKKTKMIDFLKKQEDNEKKSENQ